MLCRAVIIIFLLCSFALAEESGYITTELPSALVEQVTTPSSSGTYQPEYGITLPTGMQVIAVEKDTWGTPVYKLDSGQPASRLIITYEGKLYHLTTGKAPAYP